MKTVAATFTHVVWDDNLSRMAREHLGRLDYGARIHYIVDEAVQALQAAEGPFDVIFNDIDKEAYPESLPVIEEKLRPGGVLLVDNMLWGGRVMDERHQEVSTKAIRELTRLLNESPNWESFVVPIQDGIAMAIKR